MTIVTDKGRAIHVQAEEGDRIARDRQLFGHAFIEVLDPASPLAIAIREALHLGPDATVGVRVPPEGLLRSEMMGRRVRDVAEVIGDSNWWRR